MKTFKVNVTRAATDFCCATIEVKADSEEQAMELAEEQAYEFEGEIDWNSYSFQSDINVSNIEK
jgi:hypothetical protein